MKCIVCGSDKTRDYWDHRLVQCTECFLVRAADSYFSCQPSGLYTETYYQGAEYADYMGERKALARNFQQRIAILRRLAPEARKLVEIGSGYGFFLEMAGRYWGVKGFEISEYAAQQAQRMSLPCIQGDYLLEDIAAEKSDIVCLWDAIEHLRTPRLVLEKVEADLRPRGVVAISTGDIGALLPRLQKARWRLIHPPTHLWYFSLTLLLRLLREVGFEPVKISYPFHYRSLRWLAGRVSRCAPRWIGDLPIPLQTGDIVEVYARKRRGTSD
ncbi:MAG: methyltransferase domain-containing protein [Acidobacteria bacterium]|nr:methyltransferase domain-containing protein [Acidobacteriota bacterium]